MSTKVDELMRLADAFGWAVSNRCGGDFSTTSPDELPEYTSLRSAIQEVVGAVTWIPVGDRLPEKNVEVLIFFAGRATAATAQYTGHPKDFDGWCFPAENQAWFDGEDDPVVTHWMPLPADPKETP